MQILVLVEFWWNFVDEQEQGAMGYVHVLRVCHVVTETGASALEAIVVFSRKPFAMHAC